MHETISSRLARFLPDTYGPSSTSYYTSCFVTLPSKTVAETTPGSRTEAHRNHAFLKGDCHLAFNQRIDISSLGISEQQKEAFARILRILDMRPSFHLNELESSLVPSTNDSALWNICDAQLEGCPEVSPVSLEKKKSRLKRYLERKNNGMATLTFHYFASRH